MLCRDHIVVQDQRSDPIPHALEYTIQVLAQKLEHLDKLISQDFEGSGRLEPVGVLSSNDIPNKEDRVHNHDPHEHDCSVW